jgi:small subunit ribosomal protein S19e
MIKIYEVEAKKFNEVLAKALKQMEEFKMPEWADFVKTSTARARPPYESDWWYKRAASILRQVYIRGVVGVNRLKLRYGGKKDRGSRPKEFRKGSGKIIRTILQQAEKAGYVEKAEGKKKGRQLTKKGLDFMNKIAEEIEGKKEKGENEKENIKEN